MRFAFSDEQLLFRDTVRDFLAKECPAEQVRAAWTSPTGRLSDVWSGLAEMGVVGLTVPEDHGGLGMHELDLVLLLEETGRAALPEPIVATTAVVAPLLATLLARPTGASYSGDPDKAEPSVWLERIASGDLAAAVVMPGVPFAANADTAGLVLVAEERRLLAVVDSAADSPDPSVGLVAQPSVDGSRRLFAADAAWPDGIVLAEGEAAASLVAAAVDRGALATAAQLLGLADQMLAMTVAYVREREQFGVPIGSFQAVKHHLADALLALEFARPVVYRAAYSMAHGLPTSSRDASMAKCFASDAATLVARHALQCHGAIGYTVEYDLHLWMKRVWALAAEWGDAAHHRARVADAVLGPL